MKKGIVWLTPPNVAGENLLSIWAQLMKDTGWEITDTVTENSALIFASSDSQLEKAIEIKGNTDIPIVLYFWGYLPDRFFNENFVNFAKTKFELIKNYVNFVLVPNPVIQNQLQYFSIQSTICTPGIDSIKIQTCPGSVTDLNRIVMIGRLVEHKSHLNILKTFANSGLSKQFYLQIVGNGELKSDLNKFIKETGIRAVISENIEDEDKFNLLKSSLCSIYASTFEGFGAPIAESLFANTPVLVSDTPWARSLYKDSVNYFENEKQLAQTILKIFSGHGQITSPPFEFSAEALTTRLSQHFFKIIDITIKDKLKKRALIAHTDQEFKEIYQEEAIRNWESSAYRFNPYWLRHWRVDYALKGLEGKTVLDIGCAYGAYAIRFAKAGFKVTALDIAPFYLEKTKELAIKYEVENNIITLEANANNIPFEDNVFDSIWMGEILEHTDTPEIFLKEALRVVKVGGVIIISTPISTNHNDPLHLTIWDDELIESFLDKFKSITLFEHLDKIAEQEGKPSCYLIKLRKIQLS